MQTAQGHFASQKILKSPEEMTKLGMIAGSGELPEMIVQECTQSGRDLFVIALENFAQEQAVSNSEHKWMNIGKVGGIVKTLKNQKVNEVVLAGGVSRPTLSSLKLDAGGMKLLNRLRKLPSSGDNSIFSTIITFLEEQGFTITGVDKLLENLLITEGVLGAVKPDKTALNDIRIGVHAAQETGKLDIGQAVIVQDGRILGVEGAEGTDRLIMRCKELHNEGAGGILVKVKKPHQDSRVDLPSIGVQTIENAHQSGLRGIAVEAGGALVINRPEVIKTADKLGLFIVGVTPG